MIKFSKLFNLRKLTNFHNFTIWKIIFFNNLKHYQIFLVFKSFQKNIKKFEDSIRNFEVPKYWSFYISSFQTLTPTLITLATRILSSILTRYKKVFIETFLEILSNFLYLPKLFENNSFSLHMHAKPSFAHRLQTAKMAFSRTSGKNNGPRAQKNDPWV